MKDALAFYFVILCMGDAMNSAASVLFLVSYSQPKEKGEKEDFA